jgi:hypothetical protein
VLKVPPPLPNSTLQISLKGMNEVVCLLKQNPFIIHPNGEAFKLEFVSKSDELLREEVCKTLVAPAREKRWCST